MLGNKYYIKEGGRSYFIILDAMIPDENCKTLHDNMKVTFCVLYTIEGVCGVGGVPSLGRRPKKRFSHLRCSRGRNSLRGIHDPSHPSTT